MLKCSSRSLYFVSYTLINYTLRWRLNILYEGSVSVQIEMRICTGESEGIDEKFLDDTKNF